jgi:hypothetical protein
MTKRGKPRDRRPPLANPRSVETLTIGWMLMVFTTLACEVIAALAYWYVMQFDRQAETVDLLSHLLLFAACLIGLLSLLLCPVVLRARRVPPPRAVVVFSLVVALAPLVSVLIACIR